MCKRPIWRIAALFACVLVVAANAEQVLINVNCDVEERDQSLLDGPLDGDGGSDVGTTWNQIVRGPGRSWDIDDTPLIDSTGAATNVNFRVAKNGHTLGCWTWGSPDLLLVTSAITGWVPSVDSFDLVFSGFAAGEKYDLYIGSFHPNENGGRALFSTTNTTTTESPQVVDNGGPNGNDSTWVQGENYVLYENLVPDANDEIIINVSSDWTTDSTKRAYVSGFQLVSSATPEKAGNPNPGNEQMDVLRDSDLIWSPGQFAATHDLYLGNSFEDANDAAEPTASGLDVNSYDPGRLEFGETYYWRVDEVNGTPDKTVYKGSVWSFEVEPYSILIPVDPNYATASSSTGNSTPDMMVNGSGLEGGVHSEDGDTMWLSAQGDLDPWLMFELGQVKKLDKMVVWNANSKSEAFIGWGIKDVNIETSMDGVDWTGLGQTSQVSRAPGQAGYDTPQTIDLGLTPAKYVRLNILSNWGGVLKQYSVSEVQFYGLPVSARLPDPASGSVGVLPDITATWRAGREAGQHTVYLSTDPNAVVDGSAPSIASNTNGVALSAFGVQLGQTCYWRVDEVNEAEAPSVWTGDVWSFTTVPYVTVDDFESYSNFSPDRPFQTWHDGFGYSADEYFPVAYPGNGTGSGVGHDIWSMSSPYFDGDIMETLITMEGSSQSMPFYYHNSATTANSEITVNVADLPVGQDWSKNGIQYLTLHFRADSLSEALDTTSSFTTEGSARWYSQTVDSHDDGDAARSGDISDNEESLMQTTVSGAGTVSFYWKVSSEADWDFLEFSIDGSVQGQISGTVDWQPMTYTISDSGSHTLAWRYFKDGAVSGGEDCGWVDTLEWDGGGQPATTPGNTGQLYAKVNGVKVDYPGSVDDVTWTPWHIDLASLGVDVQNVTTLAIGIDGDDASGTLYFDNFRLEPAK